MPWKPEDADKHKKGLSDQEKKRWAAVANSAISRCMEKMDDTKDCEGSAIRQANSVVGSQKMIVIDDTELSLADRPVADLIKSLSGRQIHDGADSGLVLLKTKGGRRHLIVRYSNNFIDDDDPPDIVSADSHRKFVAMVNAGVVPPPSLQFMHERDWEIGEGKWVAYDESGFAFAGFDIKPGLEEITDVIAQLDDVRASHSMPLWSISRDPDDPRIIVEHITDEVTLGPGELVANKFSSVLLPEELHKMADKGISGIPKAVKDQLMKQWGVRPETLERIEAINAEQASAAAAQGRERKMLETPAAEAPAAEAPATEAAAAESQPAKAEPEVTPPAEAAEVTPESLTELTKMVSTIMEAVITLGDRFNETQQKMEARFNALEQEDEQKVAKMTAMTPLASLQDIMRQTAIGREETVVDGRTKLAKMKPQETAPEPAGRVGVLGGIPTFLDDLVSPAPAKGQEGS